MDQKKDNLDEFIRDELQKEAQELQAQYMSEGSRKIPESLKKDMREKLHAQIDDYELERLYSSLPEEDREALRLGKRMMRRKGRRMYFALAAVIVLVLAIGMTSIGGPERIIAMMKSMVGDREVVQVDSNEDNMIIVREDEEEAYQKIQEIFGTEPVKIIERPKEMKFKYVEIDEKLQTAELLYRYKENTVIYIMSATYADTSWGVDVEDKVTDKYSVEKKGQEIEVKEYETPETHTKRYSARFTYKGSEYFLMATMEKKEFENIIKRLYFVR